MVTIRPRIGWLLGIALAACLACRPAPPTRSTFLRLADLLDGSQGSSADRFGIRITRGPRPRVGHVDVEGDKRRSLSLAAPSVLRFRSVVPRAGAFQFALAVDPPQTPVGLQLVDVGRGEIYSERFEGGGTWRERSIELDRYVGETLELELSVEWEGRAAVSLAHPEIVGHIDERRRPNVLIYVIDCLRADHVGAYGYVRPTTPAIDRLAEDGVVFESSYSCAAWTKPSTGCLFTSLYPLAHGAQTIDDVLDSGNPTLAETVRSRGYTTAAWVANPIIFSEAFGFTRGFDRMVATVEHTGEENLIALEPDAADITRSVVSWLDDHGDRLFFLYLHSLDAHYSYRPRPPFDGVFLDEGRKEEERELDLYDNEVAYNDRELGRIIQTLEKLGLYDDTLIIVTSDHGEEFGEHGYRRHGHTLFESAIRVPWILKLPRSLHRGRRVRQHSVNLDVAPTVLDAVGIVPPQSFQGYAWTGFLNDGGPPPRRLIYSEQLSASDILYAARSDRYKYIYRLIPEPEQLLFDLVNDPGETHDLSDSAPEEAEPLVNALHELVLLGQGGYHFSIFHPDAPRWVVVDVRTEEARIAEVHRFSYALEEELTVSPDRRRLFYKFRTRDRRRHLVLRTDPPGAPIWVRLSVGDDPIPREDILLGEEGRRPESASFPLTAEATRVDLPTAATLLRRPETPARIWYLQPVVQRERARIDPELESMLRALGYVK